MMKKQFITILVLIGFFGFAVSANAGFFGDFFNKMFPSENGLTFGGTTLFPGGGGTGTSTPPTYGKLLVGNSGGTYTLTATSTLGITASVPDPLSVTKLTATFASTTAISGINANFTNFYGALVGNASTATALYANGANCSANQYPLGVDASGAVENCTADANTTYTATYPITLTGTAFGTAISTSTGDWGGTFDSQEGTYYLNAANLTNFGTPFYAYFSATNTDALSQGSTNKYWSNTLWDNRMAATTSVNSIITLSNLSILKAQVSDFGTYESVLTFNYPLSRATNAVSIVATSSMAIKTSDLVESGSLFYTDARSRAAISSSATGLTYTSATGDFSLTSGYLIPTTAMQTTWNNKWDLASSTIPVNKGGTGLTSATAGYFLIGGNGTLQATSTIFISSTGNVGIGTAAPTLGLQVEKATTGVVAGFYATLVDAVGEEALIHIGGLNTTSHYGVMIGATPEVSLPSAQDHSFIVKTNPTTGTGHIERFRITSDGNVGIGTTVPSYLLTVNGNIGTNGYLYATSTNIGTLTVTGATTLATSLSGLLGLNAGVTYAVSTSTLNIGGLAGTATALASDPTDCAANTWANAIAASGNLTCAAVTYAGISAMTSANLASVLSDEVGTGKVALSQYPAFTYSTSTSFTGTTTIPLGPAFLAETWDAVQCFTDVGTLNVSFYDGTNRMNLFNASTTVGTVTLNSNNTFTASEKRYADIGTAATAPTRISCTIKKSF